MPLWTLEPPEALKQSCFGYSLAQGDFNADGFNDLVVTAPPCTGTRTNGHVALYPGVSASGTGPALATEPLIVEMDWQNSNTRIYGNFSQVSLGNVNGDAYPDLLVNARAGVLVFSGQADLGAMFQAPLFRLPTTATVSGASLGDFNGDGLDDLVTFHAGTLALHLATPGAEAPFSLLRTFTANRYARPYDTNGDGLQDLLVVTTQDSRLFLGCKVEQAGACEGGLTTEPTWSIPEPVTGFFPDQNGDGYAEVLRNELGRVRLHLFEPQGGVSPVALWSLLGDAAYPGFGGGPYFVGDLDKNNHATEFLLSAGGRLYAFFPQQEVSADLRAGWAWAQSDAVGPRFQGFVRHTPVAAGDLNGDGYDDLLVGVTPPNDTLAPTNSPKTGKVLAFGGGKVPPLAPTPFLQEPKVCGLSSSSSDGGKPDVTVDGDVLARTMYVERRSFDTNSCEVMEGCVLGTGERRLLRFSVSIPNLGKGTARIPPPDQAPELFEFDICHLHAHLIGFARYELRDAEQNVTTVGRKQGFLLVDLNPYCGDAAAPFYEADGSQLISPGWADVYTADLACQWLDVTDVPDGTYTLRVEVDKNDILDEDDVYPNFADVKLQLSGDSLQIIP